MTILVGVGGGLASLIMPTHTEITSAQTEYKTASATATSSTSSLWKTNLTTAIGNGMGWDLAQLTVAADTNEQTVIDISGAGILTHVSGPGVGSSGTVTIRVTIDGVVLTFVSDTLGSDLKFSIGDFLRAGGATSATNGGGIGSFEDRGYGISLAGADMMTTPAQSILRGVGLKFTASLKVTVQGSVNLSAADGRKEASAHYLDYIPEGF